MKLFNLLYFHIGGTWLLFWDTFRHTFRATYNDCAGDVDGKQRLEAQMTYDGVMGPAYYVYNTTQLGYLLLTVLQRAEFNNKPAILHGNLAPRGGHRGNGTQFCIAPVGKSWVIATAGGRTWSVLAHFGLVSQVYQLDFALCIDMLHEYGLITNSQREGLREEYSRYKEIRDTQFRSLLLSWLLRFYRLGFKLSGEWLSVAEVCDTQLVERRETTGEPVQFKVVVGHRDKPFPNIYLLATAEDLGLKPGDEVYVEGVGNLRYVSWLSELPENTLALCSASAGYGGRRFLCLTAKCEPDEDGVWPDKLPWVKVGQTLVFSMAPEEVAVR